MEDIGFEQKGADDSAVTIVSLIIANVFVIATIMIPMAVLAALQ